MTEDKIPKLFMKTVKQEPWIYQVEKDLKESIKKKRRIIDTYSLKDINEMYENNEFRCDDCGKPMPISNDFTIREHVIHILNPNTSWSCTECLIDLHKKGCIIAGDIASLYSEKQENIKK